MTTRRHRAISPVEWGYLAVSELRPPQVIQLVVTGAGRLHRDEWERAATLASAATPGTRLVRRGRYWSDTGRPSPVRLVTGLDSALRRSLDPHHGPASEIYLADGDPATVVFRIDHSVMDARGTFLWVDNVFRALRGERPEPAASVLTESTLLDELGPRRVRTHPAMSWSSPLTDAGAAAPTGRFGWIRRTLPGRFPGFVARLSVAVARVIGNPARIMVPVDLRRHAPHVSSTANLSLPLFLDVEAGESWRRAHRRLLLKMARREELALGMAERVAGRLPLPLARAGLRAVDRYSLRQGRYICSALISHPGRVNLSGFSSPSFGATSVHWLPTHAPFVPLSFVVTETAEVTEVVMSHSESQRAHAETLFADFLAALPR
ncbi:hypothetical protein HH310_42015 [Actinoplanes sp. TBRC 11911]|uniref:hypothetical protein n=1 Tax=Actinoplanes sp. TBRC 11911 TaxID=2729386 RepID=UPI00145E82DA|nr:hypothetical protein [Actinoplanes sp. TBRC 11911]NMO57727.1 hypothetical protein [Actinoplanes sp. TBRC 11911]